MVELSPRVVGGILVVVLTVTTTQYWIAPPMANSNNNNNNNGNGKQESDSKFDVNNIKLSGDYEFVYGAPNAEFEWCESNFQWTDYVAEPLNTLSGFLYFLPAVAAFRFHDSASLSLTTKLNFLFVAWIGVGTILFHMTLRYTAQLID